MRNRLGLFCLAVLALSPAAALAQGSVAVDEGTFTIQRGGVEVGTETFSIRRSGTGADQRMLATARIHLAGTAGIDLVPLMDVRTAAADLDSYQIKVSGTMRQEVTLQVNDRLITARTLTDEGENVREHRLQRGMILLDEEVAHHFHFLGVRLAAGQMSMPVMVPRRGAQEQAQAQDAGSERLLIGGAEVEARRFTLQVNGEAVSVWFDGQWRVLRVDRPGYQALRRELP